MEFGRRNKSILRDFFNPRRERGAGGDLEGGGDAAVLGEHELVVPPPVGPAGTLGWPGGISILEF